MTTRTTPAKPRKRSAAAISRARHRGVAESLADASVGVSSPMPVTEPQREQVIRSRAYAIYESRGCAQGRALDDWLAAEDEVNRAALAGGAAPECAG